MPHHFTATEAGVTVSVDFPTQAEIFQYIGYEMLLKLISSYVQYVSTTGKADTQDPLLQALKSLQGAVAFQEAVDLPRIDIT